MTLREEASRLVERQARMTNPAATVEGQKESLLWSRSESTAKYLTRDSTSASAFAALR